MRAGLLGACAFAVVLLAVIPGPSDSPIGRLANVESDGPDPRYDVALDGAAIRRAGAIVPDDATYAVLAPGASPLLQGNLKAAAQLFLAPALPVQDRREADWIVVYDAPSGLRGGLRLGRRLTLFRGRR